MKRCDQRSVWCSFSRLPQSGLTLRLAFTLLLVVPSISYAGPQAPQGAVPTTSYNPPSLSGNGSGNQGGTGQGGAGAGGSTNNGGATGVATPVPKAKPTTLSGNQNQGSDNTSNPGQIRLEDTALGISVTDLFQRVLGRKPYAFELENRVKQLQNSRDTRVTMQQMEREFFASNEYYKIEVTKLYKKYLYRGISEDGLKKLFNAKPRPALAAVEQSLIYSEEYVERWVGAQFRELLGRCPYDTEYNKLVNRLLQKKVTFDAVRDGIRNSKEAAAFATRKVPLSSFQPSCERHLCPGTGNFDEESSEWESPVWCKRNTDGTKSFFFRQFSDESDVGHPYYVDFPISSTQYAELKGKWETSNDTVWAITKPDGSRSYFLREYSQDPDGGSPHYIDFPISRVQYDAMRKLRVCLSADDFEFVDEASDERASERTKNSYERAEELLTDGFVQCLTQHLNASGDDKNELMCLLYGGGNDGDLGKQLMTTCMDQHLNASGYVEDEMLCAVYYPEYFVKGYFQRNTSGSGGIRNTLLVPNRKTRRSKTGAEPAGPFDQLGDCFVRVTDTFKSSFDGFLSACGLTNDEKYALGLPTTVKKRSRGLFKGLRCKARK